MGRMMGRNTAVKHARSKLLCVLLANVPTTCIFAKANLRRGFKPRHGKLKDRRQASVF
jgi:hypothetical protein